MGVAALAAGAVLAVERAIVTDREAIAGTLAGLGAALERADATGALAVFASDFAAEGVDRDGLGEVLRLACAVQKPARVAVDTCETTVEGDTARSVVTWNVVAGGGDGPRVPGALHAVLLWRREGTDWRIRGIGDEPGRPHPVFDTFGQIFVLRPSQWRTHAGRRP